jgi:hypothetical protein
MMQEIPSYSSLYSTVHQLVQVTVVDRMMWILGMHLYLEHTSNQDNSLSQITTRRVGYSMSICIVTLLTLKELQSFDCLWK